MSRGGGRAMTTERMLKILLEVANGVEPPEQESAEDAAVRAALKSEVAAIRARGGIIDVPPELP